MNHWDSWLERATNGASGRAIAAALGLSNSTVSSWASKDRPPAEHVVSVARAYDADPVEGLIAAGYLTDDDMQGLEVLRGVRSATRLQLTEELFRRELMEHTDSMPAIRLGEELELRPLSTRV